MDTQNTPIHIRLWHRDFWFLVFANFLLSTIVYMQLATLERLLVTSTGIGLSSLAQGTILGVYGLGIFLLGPYCHYLVQRYRRKRVC